MYTKLPTIRQAQQFHKVINRGRVAAGLEPLDKLDFDGATPGSTVGCLSATNLFSEAGYGVATLSVFPNGDTQPRVLKAVGMAGDVLPFAIRRVTDPFDDETEGLRERLVEAGVVAP